MSNQPGGIGLWRRFLALLAAWTLLFLAGPGVATRLHPAFSSLGPLLAPLAIALWGITAARDVGERPRRAFLAEMLASAIGWVGPLYWVALVFGPALIYVALGMGCYGAVAGWCLRRYLRRIELAPAILLAWVGVEALRAFLPPPFGFGWLLLGHHLVEVAPVLASARVFGLEGLCLVAAGLAGGLGGVIVRRRFGRAEALTAFVPLFLALVAGFASSPPPMVEGPRILLVQPGFDQARKQFSDPDQNFASSRDLTLQAAHALAEPPDLVCWGESMLFLWLAEPGVREDLERGAEVSQSLEGLDARSIDAMVQLEREWVLRSLCSRLPAGTSFLTGSEVLALDAAGKVRRRNAVVLYDAEGRRSPAMGKQHLVPGAESLLGLERFAFARDAIYAVAAYVPDLEAVSETGVFELRTRDGGRFHLGATVCFDNAFLGPYVEPLAKGPVDIHVVVSNEAWYLGSWEMDQMIAFSRVIAVATGRSLVRATNSGVSCVIDPEGRELARVRTEGRDRAVAGTLALRIPVPARNGEDPSLTPYIHLRPLLRFGVILVPALILLLSGRRSSRPR